MMPSRRASGTNKPACALVTGGAVRLGRALTLALADAGFDVVIAYRHSARDAARTVRDARRRGVRAFAIRANLADPAAARRLVAVAAARLGGLDVLVNNAAVFSRTPLSRLTPSAYDAIVDVNLRAPLLCAQAAARVMRRGAGHIVNVGDAASGRPMPGYIPYVVTKAAMPALTRSLAAALRPRGIAVNCIAPGTVLRPRGFPLARWRALTRGREAAVDDVLSAAVFFATCPTSLTGQTLRVE